MTALYLVFIFPHQSMFGFKMLNLIGNCHAQAKNAFKRPWSKGGGGQYLKVF